MLLNTNLIKEIVIVEIVSCWVWAIGEIYQVNFYFKTKQSNICIMYRHVNSYEIIGIGWNGHKILLQDILFLVEVVTSLGGFSSTLSCADN